MTFDYPVILFGLILLIPLSIIDIIFRRKTIRQLSDELKKKLRASVLLFRLFLAFSVIALSGPRWGTGYAPAEYSRGLDTVFAVDVSRSMDIRDAYEGDLSVSAQDPLPQSRLERGLSIARETILYVPGARYAAAVGRSRGYLAIPLTYDNESALVFLEALDGSSMTGRSTNLESLIEAASQAFQSASPAQKVIVLLSDGESHAGILRNILNHCAKEGIMIIAVAVGSDEGRLIQETNNLGAAAAQQAAVISRRDSAVMRNIAGRTGGVYIDGGRGDAVSLLSSHLVSLSAETESSGGTSVPKQRRTLFIILALVSYCASKFVTRKYSPRKLQLASIIAAVLFFSSCSEGKLLLLEANYYHSRNRFNEAAVSYMKALDHKDAAPYAEYGLGLTLYLLDQEDTALNRYANSRKSLEASAENEHRELRYRNYYNSGIIFFEKDDFHSAAASFREALKTDPRKIEAKRNLELSLLAISMEPSAQNNTESHQEQKEILFDYLREEEQKIWRSREWSAEEDFTGPDY